MALEERLANRKGVFGYTPLHEAVASGHHDVLDYLLKKAGDTHVNCRANSGYTPLHLAASSGHAECVRVLLKHNADISVTDEYGKTPKQTAELSSKSVIVRILRGAEILNEVRTNGNNLTELLQDRVEQLEPDCLNKALIAAVENDHHQNVGKLIVKGATNISEALKLAVAEKKVYASAMLMLVYAAIDGNCNLVLQLFDEIEIDKQPCKECSKASGDTFTLFSRMLNYSTMDDFQDCLQRIRRALKSSNMPTTIPIEIARRNITATPQKALRCGHVREELLMKTDVNKEDKSVHWQGLGLRSIEIAWFKRVDWVKSLLIGRNQLKVLPKQIGVHLKQVTKLDIQYNELEKIPEDLLLLPCLVDLNLSHNMLQELPAALEWSPSLTTLDLSHNNLRNFPPSVEAPSMIKLSISHNHFRSVPKSICSFSSLQYLDISDNQDILNLPVDMGRLSNLTTLILTNLKDLHDPPRAVQGDARDCIHYLNQKLHNVKRFFKMKLMLVGCAERGKTTLVATLQREKYQDMERTVGVDVSEWKYQPRYGKPTFQFSIWDFGGQKEYYSTHQCFLSKRSMYLLVFNLTHSDRGVQEMKPWLNNIALRAPWSLVIIVGTHLDCIPEDQRAQFVTGVLHKVKRLAQGYSKLIIPEVVPVSLRPPIENINLLKDTIYKNAAEYKYKRQLVMGQQIPTSYHKLDKQLQIMREARREMRQPIMHHKEFQGFVQQMNLNIHGDGELRTATIFLRDVGSLLHYDDRTHNLHELYFIDPHWLCKMMAKIVGPDLGRRVQIKDGILHRDQIRRIFSESDRDFPEKYFQQYLTLLYRFEIALPLDQEKLLVTSMLNEKCPHNVDIENSQDPPFHTRYITFGSAETPPGFWSRYLSRIMYSISRASDALHLNTAIPSALIESMSLGVSGEACQNHAPDKARYWESGFFLNDGEVAFRVESLSGSRTSSTKEHGILMVASPNCPAFPNNEGTKIIGQLVDMALSLLRELYPGLTEIKQRIPCYECVRMCRKYPYEFTVEECWLAMEEQKSTIECKYDTIDPTKNHTMVVSKIVPDLFLQDIDHSFLLSQSQIKNEEQLLTRPTDYEKICYGIYRGKFVTIMYPYKSKEALSKVRSEVRELQKWHHPCLTCLMGVIVHPRIAVIMEKAPENSLEWPLITQKSPIHRITLFRIAAQVAAALKFLHKNRLFFRALQASNVLMWTLDPDSLCHCKLANYAISTQLHQTKIRGLHDTRGFVAPEALHLGGGARYNEKADIFSFGMLLYQIISRNNPYHDAKDNNLFYAAVQKGERPTIPNVGSAAFHYLTLVMEACWDGNPENRPTAQNLLTYLCLSSTQAVMSVISTKNESSMRQAQVVKTQRCNDIWICSDGKEDLEISVYSLSTMKKAKSQFMRNIMFSSMCLCKDYLWIATRCGVSYGRLGIFNPNNHRQEFEIPQWDYMVSCISCSDEYVYIGTIDGLCFSFPIDLKRIKHNPKPIKKELPETKPINDFLLVTHAGKKTLWVSHTRYLYFLLPDNLEMEHVQYRGDTDDMVGTLSITPQDNSVVWSAHIGGSMLSAWDVGSRSMRFEVNASKQLSDIKTDGGGQHAITAMTAALDTVWVGMTSGHILVFADQELLTWYRPYISYLQFITVIPGPGPCKTEECMILTGGQKLRCLIPAHLKECNAMRKGTPGEGGAAMILWEAFSKKTTRQASYIKDKSSGLFENFKTLRDILKKEDLGFTDGTHILPEDTFIVKVQGEENEKLEVTCPKPLKLAALIEKIKKKINTHDMIFKLEYRSRHLGPEKCLEICSQEDIEAYARLEERPELLCHLIPTT